LSWLDEAFALFAKEWRCELRTRYALNTLVLFAFTTLVVVSAALGPIGVSRSQGSTVPAVLLWILLLFAATAGLPRAFVHEEESGTATALRLAARPSAVFCGKLLYCVVLVLALEVVVVPLFTGVMELSVKRPGEFIAVLIAGGYGLAAGSTIVAAMIAQARGAATLFAVLSFPILLPVLLLSVEVTGQAWSGVGGLDALIQIILYDASITIGGFMLFPSVWNP
jgi:heme exporter protein B